MFYIKGMKWFVEYTCVRILVPKFYQTGSLCLSFYYNMNGFNIGSLEVYTVANGSKTTRWSQSGNHGDVWLRATVTVTVQFDDQVRNSGHFY